MHVVLLIDDFFPSFGGIGRSVEAQIQELADLRHRVSPIASDRHLEKPRSCCAIERPTIYVEGLPAHLSILYNSERRTRLITKYVRFDVVHTQTERGALILGARIARLQGIPHPHTSHINVVGTHQTVKTAIFDTWPYQSLISPLLTRTVGRASSRSRLVSRSQELGGLAARMDWAPFVDIAGKVNAWTVSSPFTKGLVETAVTHRVPEYVVSTGVGRGMLDAIPQARGERFDEVVRFTTAGRLVKEKCLDVLVWAFRRIDIPGSELVIVEDGDQRLLLKTLVANAGNIDFRGHLHSLDAIAYELVNSDVLVLTSHRFDSQALVPSEAATAGLPILYRDDRLTVVTSPESALPTEPDISSPAAGTRKLVDFGRCAVMCSAPRGLLEGLTLRCTAEAYVSIYEELIGAKSA